jgi:hypothetical protein
MEEQDSGGRRLYATRHRAMTGGPRNALAHALNRWRGQSARSLNRPSALSGVDTAAAVAVPTP